MMNYTISKLLIVISNNAYERWFIFSGGPLQWDHWPKHHGASHFYRKCPRIKKPGISIQHRVCQGYEGDKIIILPWGMFHIFIIFTHTYVHTCTYSTIQLGIQIKPFVNVFSLYKLLPHDPLWRGSEIDQQIWSHEIIKERSQKIRQHLNNISSVFSS